MKQSHNITIEDVAEEAGVSANTVSRALNDKDEIKDETKERILKIADRMGYKPNRLAQGLRSDKTGVIGVIIPDNTNPYFAAVVKGIEQAARSKGYSIILKDTNEDHQQEKEAIKVMLSEQVDGILITPVQTDQESIRHLQEAPIPFVLVSRYFKDLDTDYVATEDDQGGYLATKHLIEQGHERIGFINGPLYNSSAKDRSIGYRKALEEYDLLPDADLIIKDALFLDDGYQEAKKLLALERPPTAIFTFSDFVALGTKKAIKEEGLEVPDDVAIVGYDDIAFLSCLESPLTTVSVPKKQIGARAMELLEKKISSEVVNRTEQIRLSVELKVRESSATPT